MGDSAAARLQLINDSEEALRQAFDGRLATLWTSMPGYIVDVNLAEMTCSVQPAIQATVTSEDGIQNLVALPKLIHCPIIFPKGGGFVITMPLKAGDEVLINWACRAIDAWWKAGEIQRPIEARMHDLSDGFVIPGPASQTKLISNISATNLQIRNESGDTYIELGADGKINMISASEINLTAPAVNINGIPFSTHRHTGVDPGSGESGGPVA